ncbi:MAG: hypothetical protein VB118_04720 [Oscillospiraceae bacterium]|nr:hypothetical protein [Oscillospiraceae bacterium]
MTKGERVKSKLMTDAEICRSYRNAADQKAQINILAQLNAVPRGVILSALERGGLYKPEAVSQDPGIAGIQTTVKKQRRYSEHEDTLICNMRLAGAPWNDIAEALGVSIKALQNHVTGTGLRAQINLEAGVKRGEAAELAV